VNAGKILISYNYGKKEEKILRKLIFSS